MRINFHDDDERPLLEQTNTTIEDFTNMIDSKGRVEVAKNDSDMVKPNIANIDSTRCFIIWPHCIIVLDAYLQCHKINDEIIQRKLVAFF
jgi:hypothetical protein